MQLRKRKSESTKSHDLAPKKSTNTGPENKRAKRNEKTEINLTENESQKAQEIKEPIKGPIEIVKEDSQLESDRAVKMSEINVSVKEVNKTELENEERSDFKIEQFLKDSEWNLFLKEEFEKDYFKKLNVVLEKGYKRDIVMPPKELVFNAFNSTKMSNVSHL